MAISRYDECRGQSCAGPCADMLGRAACLQAAGKKDDIGLEYIVESIPSSRDRATPHRGGTRFVKDVFLLILHQLFVTFID